MAKSRDLKKTGAIASIESALVDDSPFNTVVPNHQIEDASASVTIVLDTARLFSSKSIVCQIPSDNSFDASRLLSKMEQLLKAEDIRRVVQGRLLVVTFQGVYDQKEISKQIRTAFDRFSNGCPLEIWAANPSTVRGWISFSHGSLNNSDGSAYLEPMSGSSRQVIAKEKGNDLAVAKSTGSAILANEADDSLDSIRLPDLQVLLRRARVNREIAHAAAQEADACLYNLIVVGVSGRDATPIDVRNWYTELSGSDNIHKTDDVELSRTIDFFKRKFGPQLMDEKFEGSSLIHCSNRKVVEEGPALEEFENGYSSVSNHARAKREITESTLNPGNQPSEIRPVDFFAIFDGLRWNGVDDEKLRGVFQEWLNVFKQSKPALNSLDEKKSLVAEIMFRAKQIGYLFKCPGGKDRNNETCPPATLTVSVSGGSTSGQFLFCHSTISPKPKQVKHGSTVDFPSLELVPWDFSKKPVVQP